MSQEQLNLETTMNAHSDVKICKICEVEKPLSEFNKSKGWAGGHHGHCKTCHRAGSKENDALKARITVRLFGPGEGVWPHQKKWYALSVERRKEERERQRIIESDTSGYTPTRRKEVNASRRTIDGKRVYVKDVTDLFAAFEEKAIEDKRFTHPELDKIRQEDGFREAAKREQKRLNGFVYLIHDLEHPGILKIGKSTDPVSRLSTLNVGSCYGTLRIHDAVYSARAYDMERAMQAIGDGRWSRTNGEWFKLNDETYDDVLNMLKEVQNDDPNF